MSSINLEIKGMHCKSCKMLVEDILDDLGVKIISFDVNEKKQLGKLNVETELPESEIIKAIENEGDYVVSKS